MDENDIQLYRGKNRLPELVREAENGNQVIITKRGIPVVEIVRREDAP